MGVDDVAKVATEAWTLRKAIRSTLDYGNHVLETGKVHSPLNEHKLAAADEAVSDAIHVGYQGVRKIAVEGHPAVILGLTSLFAALPSIPWGARATARNSILGGLLAAAMIYPDHIARRLSMRDE